MEKLESVFRKVALVEGASYLVLVLVAMPLKYGMGQDLAVKIFGSVHGGLTILFLLLLAGLFFGRKWGFWKSALAFVSSLVPFGAFIFEAKLKREELAGS